MSLKLLSGNTPQIIYCSMPLYPLFQPCSAQAVSVSVALIDHEQLLATPTVAGRASCPTVPPCYHGYRNRTQPRARARSVFY